MKDNCFCIVVSMLLLVESIKLHGLNLPQPEHQDEKRSADFEQKKHKAFKFNSSTAYSDLIKLKSELSACKKTLQEDCSFPSPLAMLALEYDDNRYYRYAQCLASLLHYHSKPHLPRTKKEEEEVVFLLQEIQCPEQSEQWEKLNDCILQKITAKAAYWSKVSCSPLIYDASRLQKFEELTQVLDEMTAKEYIHEDVGEEFGQELARSLPTVVNHIVGNDSSVNFKDYDIAFNDRSARLSQLIKQHYINRYSPDQMDTHRALGFNVYSLGDLFDNRSRQEVNNMARTITLSEIQSLGPTPSFEQAIKCMEGNFTNMVRQLCEGSSSADKQRMKKAALLSLQNMQQEIETSGLSETEKKQTYDLCARIRLTVEEACGPEEVDQA